MAEPLLLRGGGPARGKAGGDLGKLELPREGSEGWTMEGQGIRGMVVSKVLQGMAQCARGNCDKRGSKGLY